MIKIKIIFSLILIYFSLTNFSNSKINLEIVMKINNEIVTSYDIDQEIGYLIALNSQLAEIDKEQLKQIAKRSIIKEIIRKNEILKYKELDYSSSSISPFLNALIQNLKLSNENDLVLYLKGFNITIDDLKKKIAIENEWKSLIYTRYIKSVKINKKELNEKLDIFIKNEFQLEYDLSEIVFEKKK